MSPPCWLIEDGKLWIVENKQGEKLVISIDEIFHDHAQELGAEPGLQKDGVEAHLQELLAEHIKTLGDGYTLVRREFPTDRKSTRPNSSHLVISYAVFCLKKKKKQTNDKFSYASLI